MLAEEMELHDDLDYHDDTALDCIELDQTLQDLEMADLDNEHNVVAPLVGEDSPDTQNGMEGMVLHDWEVEVIDVDELDFQLHSAMISHFSFIFILIILIPFCSAPFHSTPLHSRHLIPLFPQSPSHIALLSSAVLRYMTAFHTQDITNI